MGAPNTQPPEATLIRLAREAAGLSAETAAGRMNISFSGSRWRQIEKGGRGSGATWTPVVAPAGTLAHMCRLLGIDSARLAETGRTDAAEILREMERADARTPEPAPTVAPLARLESWQQQVILNALDERPRSDKEKALLLRMLAAQLDGEAVQDETPASHEDEPSDRSA
ncbi:helix-turn-helix domain-containing protein [Streptomyces sp. NPDC007903]|uniref:helix-turn-helix domain-containing protein n=1 Tax=Streptomyces sp. NPDC007903 TaxID=3364786 RepID=UPI0036E0D9B2